MKNIIYYLLISIGLICSLHVKGQLVDKQNLEAKIDALVPAQVNDTTPGLVIGIVQNGELIFSKGYGLANLTYGMPNDPNMVYNIGSVSKQFLGYAFALLHADGVLNLDDPVSQYLEDWPEFKHRVSLRHLLSHTSGYREAYTMSNLAGRIVGVDRLSRKECLDVVRKQAELEFVPGSRYTYNSTAWVILAEVLEKVTGQSADIWVEKYILQALGMEETQIESYVGEVIRNTAESYSYDKEKGYINEKSNRAIFGAAEVYANIPDLVKWINNYRSADVGGKAVKDLFLDPFILKDGLSSGYALGIGVGSYRGLKRYRHTGGHEAFASQLSYYPDYDLGIITISNYGGKGWLPTSKIADILLEAHLKPKSVIVSQGFEIKARKLKQYEGLYVASTMNRSLDLKITDDTLSIGGRTKLIPLSKNRFRIKGMDDEIQFTKQSGGGIEFVNSRNERYTRVEAWTPKAEELAEFKGDYRSEELETVYHLMLKEGKLSIHHRWLGEIPLEAIAKDLFKTQWGYFVKFNRNKSGAISNLSISSGRTLNVVFQR